MGRNSDRTQPCAKRTPTVPGELTKAVAAADVNQSGSLATERCFAFGSRNQLQALQS